MAKSRARKKRAEGGFKTGNVPYNAGKYYEKEEADKCMCVTYTRLNQGLHNRVTKQLLPYAEDDANSAVNNHEFRLLRPSPSAKSAVNEAAETVTDTWYVHACPSITVLDSISKTTC